MDDISRNQQNACSCYAIVRSMPGVDKATIIFFEVVADNLLDLY